MAATYIGNAGDLGRAARQEAGEFAQDRLCTLDGTGAQRQCDLVQVGPQRGGQDGCHARPLVRAPSRMQTRRGVAELGGWRSEDPEVEQGGLGSTEALAQRQLQLAVGTVRACSIDQCRTARIELQATQRQVPEGP